MSIFRRLFNEVQKLCCTVCFGTGECDDAEPGDISYNHWTCSACGGTGLNKEVTSIEILDTGAISVTSASR